MTTNRLYKPTKTQSPDGLPICLCGCGRRVHPPRKNFTNKECYYRFKVKSDAAFAREQVFARDAGVCAVCRTDTVAVLDRLRRMTRRERNACLVRWNIPVRRFWTGSLWDMDHIVAVSDGGGECDVDNLQTLCLSCHRRKTATQATQRALKRQQVSVLSEARLVADAVRFD